MAKFARGDGGDEVNVFPNRGGIMGIHWTLWGCDICIHIYQDGYDLSEEKLLEIAQVLERK